jgi:hypothetical protein
MRKETGGGRVPVGSTYSTRSRLATGDTGARWWQLPLPEATSGKLESGIPFSFIDIVSSRDIRNQFLQTGSRRARHRCLFISIFIKKVMEGKELFTP